MIKIGLTGGIGSGKTVVANLLEMKGIPVYIADEEGKRLTDTSPVIREKLIALFGEDIYTSTGVNRKLLASYIFNDTQLLKQVNSVIHPEVQLHFLHWAVRQESAACVIESAILFESGFDKIVDVRLMVYTPVDVRIERAFMRGTGTREEIRKRIENQLSDEEKKIQSDYVILNDNKAALIPQIEEFLLTIV